MLLAQILHAFEHGYAPGLCDYISDDQDSHNKKRKPCSANRK
jgi:hypothetical protein